MAKKVRSTGNLGTRLPTAPRPAVQAAQEALGAAQGGNGPTASTAPAAASPAAARKTRVAKPRVNRRDFKYAVFVGKAPRVAAWCKTEAEVAAFLSTVKPSRLACVDVGVMQPVAVKIEAQIGKLG